MWVWIPRYAYKITEGYHSATAGTIEVAFLDTDNHFFNGETGDITDDPTESGSGTSKWLVHPAFTSNAEYGGGFGELEGLWVGKFEATASTDNTITTADTLCVKPAKSSVGGYMNPLYRLAKTSTFGESETINSHMAKNSEWGVIVYLGHSKYGTNKQKVERNTQGTTGGGLETVIYTTNKKQSTTYNATGVYDTNGCQYEHVASYIYDYAAKYTSLGGTSSGDLYGATSEERTTSTAYKTVYDSSFYSNKKYKGDAFYETSSMANSLSSNQGYTWYAGYNCLPDKGFFGRGAIRDGAYNSNFGYYNFLNGYASNVSSVRVILAIQ